ncbi:hypothetical protein, partial [Rhodoferax sp.]|uniref:hypothetical protein n=1 Tax=Rhodoferax sp. TaxID=50421 RepID=UPI0027703369|nr:hypothetical protein [Rhodoferax sp.]
MAINREHLSGWSLELADEAFAPALAALGAMAALDRSALGQAYGAGVWRVERLAGLLQQALRDQADTLAWFLPATSPRHAAPRIRVAGAQRGKTLLVAAPRAVQLASIWREFLSALPPATSQWPSGPRLALRASVSSAGLVMDWASVLSRPEVGAASVYLDQAFPCDGRTDWRWPFTLLTLPADPLQAALAQRQAALPPNWPYRFASASREAARAEVLVIGAGASDALERVLASGLQLRCCLVIVAGLGTDSARGAEPLLRALVARVRAEGIAVLESGRSANEFAEHLSEFADQLSHNLPVDVALTLAFRPGALLLLNRDLLTVSHLDTTVTRVTKGLRRLPQATKVLLTPQSLSRLGVPMAKLVSYAPRDIADAIDATRARYRFDHESSEASAIAELSRSVESHTEASARRKATPRYLQQLSFRKQADQFVEERAGYCVGQSVMVQVLIGPKRPERTAASMVFPEDKLFRQGQARHRLQVVLHEPRQFDQPLLREILLPRVGDSSVAEFVFTPSVVGPFEARLSVLHRGRVLQTVLLHTRVAMSAAALQEAGSCITLDDETQVRRDWSDLGKRRHFDLAMVLNHTQTGEAMLTGIAGQRAWAKHLGSDIQDIVSSLNTAISAVAHSVADYGDGLDQGDNPALLVSLARDGADLYSLLYLDQLKRLSSGGFDAGDESVTYLQVISARQDAVIPLEFMYDFNPPRPGATVCPQHREALAAGRCPQTCARSSQPTEHVCPMGFWGLKKVIERHMFDPLAMPVEGAEVVLQVEAIDGRDHLDLRAGSLVGHSQEVQPAEVSGLIHTLGTTLGSQVTLVKDWADWMNTVKTKHPALLVAFPHNEGKARNVLLEIGGNKLYTLGLSPDYVHTGESPPPLVLLLGCDVAGTAQEFSNHIRYFRQAGAAVVVSTIATVFGAHAVRVGEAIVAGLAQAGEPGKLRIGEIIRDAKRAALLDSVPMALCVVAFG